MPWALIAALFTATILVGTKMFDYYHNKAPNDLKLYLDIEKAMKENGHDEKDIAFIRNIAKTKLTNLEDNQREKKTLKKYFPKMAKKYIATGVIGIYFIVIGIFSWIIQVAFWLKDATIKIDLPIIGSFFLLLGFIAYFRIEFIDKKVEEKSNYEY